MTSKQPRQPISKGFAAGLQIWLLFLLSLYWLGYPALFSIGFGAIGGLASGLIVDWWVSKDERTEPEKKPAEDEGLEEIAQTRKRRRNSALQHQKQRKQRKQGETFNWKKLNPFDRHEEQ